MNQRLKNDVLYTSRIGGPITELRKSGDNLVLYTESNEVYKRFKTWKDLIQKATYTLNKDLIAVDLYFPRSARKALIRALTSKEKGSTR